MHSGEVAPTSYKSLKMSSYQTTSQSHALLK